MITKINGLTQLQ